MEGSPKAPANHLDAVADLLFDRPAVTPEEHLAVIERGFDPGSHDYLARFRVLHYAREHLEGSQQLDVELGILEESQEATSNGWIHEPNQVIEVLMDVESSSDPVSESLYGRALTQLDRILAMEGSLLNMSDEERYGRSPFNQPEKQETAVSKMITRAAEKVGIHDSEENDYLVEVQARRAVYAIGVADLATRLVTRSEVEFEEPASVLGATPTERYLEIAQWLKNVHLDSSEREPEVQQQVDLLIDKVLARTGPDTPDAVNTCLEIADDSKLNYRGKSNLIFKAIDITRRSSRDPEVSESRSVFGFKRERTQRPPFERRRLLLQERISDNLLHYIDEQPDVVTAVMGLYDPETEKATLDELWGEYAAQVAGRNFMNGHYDIRSITGARAELSQFEQIAPPEAAQRAERLLKERLATSSAGRRRF